MQKLQLQVLHCPVIKQFCLSLCTVQCSLVPEWVTEENPHIYSILQALENSYSHDHPNSPTLYPLKCSKSCNSVPSAKYSALERTFYSSL